MTTEAKKVARLVIRDVLAAADVFAEGSGVRADFTVHLDREDVLRACAERADATVRESRYVGFDSATCAEGERVLLAVDLPEQRACLLFSAPVSSPAVSEVEA